MSDTFAYRSPQETRFYATRIHEFKNYKERVTTPRIRLHRKFAEKMAIHDHYIPGLNNRQKKGKDEPKRRLFHNLSGIPVQGRTGQSLQSQVLF